MNRNRPTSGRGSVPVSMVFPSRVAITSNIFVIELIELIELT